nr:MAG TPA: hypothetical protein [Caudoviricetes sp.]
MIRGLLSDDKFRFYDNTNNNGNLNGKVGRFSFPKIGKRGQSKTNVIIFL